MSGDDWFERALAQESTNEGGTEIDEGGDDPDGLFDTDFAAEFEDISFEDDAESPFDEPLDSTIPRIIIGIEGLDAMIHGGVPEQALITVIGTAGTGKTTLGLQFLREGLYHGERAVFIALEQSRDEVLSTATEFGWAFDEYADAGDLAIVDIDPVDMAQSLGNIRGDLPRLIDDFGARRIVLDSVSLLEMMYEDPAKRRNEIYDFTRSLKQAGVTTLLTSEASTDSDLNSKFGVVEYLTDAVITLRNIRTDDFRESRLAIEIQKIRNTNHSRETKPYDIGEGGITVYRQATIF